MARLSGEVSVQDLLGKNYWRLLSPDAKAAEQKLATLQQELLQQESLLTSQQLQLVQWQRQQQELKQQQMTAAKALWVNSTAPVGEHPGIRRFSFSIAGRTIATGCTALLYYQQEQAETGYTAIEKKPIKRNARVMLAVATVANPATQGSTDPAKNQIAVLDFAVSRVGSLAQVADSITLPLIDKSTTGSDSLNPTLENIQKLEADILQLRTEISTIENARVPYTPENLIVNNIALVPRSLAVGVQEDFYPQIWLQFEITVPPSLEVILDWILYRLSQETSPRTDVIAGGTTFRPFNAIPGVWTGMVKRLTVRRATGSQAITDLSQQLIQKQSELENLKDSLIQEVKLLMPFLQADPEGLTVMGALLGFAWTDHAPLLFERMIIRVASRGIGTGGSDGVTR